MITKNMVFPALLLLLLAASCTKDKTIAVSEADRQSAELASQEYLMAGQIFENIFREVDTQARQQGKLNGFKDPEGGLETRGNCPEIKLDFTENTIFPASLTLNYGSGCSENGGPEIAGQITAVFNGLLLSPGTSISLSYTNFEFAGHAVSGKYEIANLGEDANGQPTFQSTVDGQVTDAAGKTIAYQALTTTKQTEGKDTNFFNKGLSGIFDDVWSTTREGILTTSDGLQVNITTPDAIKSPLNCKWPVSGLFSLDINNPDVKASINFGSGSCDDKALLTIGDYTKELDL